MPLSKRPERGITLLESLVAILLLALGVFSVLGIQMRILSDAQAGIRRSQAIRLVEDLRERISTNPEAAEYISTYVAEAPSLSANTCSTPCSTAELAIHDIAQWHQAVKSTFINGKAYVFQSTADSDLNNQRQLGVMLAWKENEREASDPAKTEALNQFLHLSSSDSPSQSCPEEYVCHLQYIHLPRRCQQSDNGGCR